MLEFLSSFTEAKLNYFNKPACLINTDFYIFITDHKANNMRYVILFFAVMLSINLHAQHCPYDGTTLVVVKLVDQKGKPVNPPKDTLYLVEIENPQAALCSYAEGLLKIPLLASDTYFEKHGQTSGANYGNELKKRLKDLGVINNANLLVSLNQAEKDCMMKKEGDYEYRKRKFVIILPFPKTHLVYPNFDQFGFTRPSCVFWGP